MIVLKTRSSLFGRVVHNNSRATVLAYGRRLAQMSIKGMKSLCINHVLKPEENTFVSVYLDDVLILSLSLDEH